MSFHIRIVFLKVAHTLHEYAHTIQKNKLQKQSTGRKVYYLLLHTQNTEKSNHHTQFMQIYYAFFFYTQQKHFQLLLQISKFIIKCSGLGFTEKSKLHKYDMISPRLLKLLEGHESYLPKKTVPGITSVTLFILVVFIPLGSRTLFQVLY